MNTKICTSKEQSQKLIELGIDIKTADMWWNTEKDYPEFVKTYHEYLGEQIQPVPCWSLAKLLDILPEGTESHKQVDGSIGYYYVEVYNNKKYFSTKRYDNPLDACVEMMCWLLENKKL